MGGGTQLKISLNESGRSKLFACTRGRYSPSQSADGQGTGRLVPVSTAPL